MERPQVLQEEVQIILFDGVCNLCSGWVYFVSRRDPDGLFKFTPIQSDPGREILAWLGLPEEGVEMMIYVEGERWYTKSSAFLRIVRRLRFPWPLLFVGIVIPRVIRDWVYDQIAAVRYRVFGKRAQCMVPDEDLQSRFL
ncbi:MAG: DCC1-like thiol-disulfide oxidoreductase family protein [Anaerolineales bacterium]